MKSTPLLAASFVLAASQCLAGPSAGRILLSSGTSTPKTLVVNALRQMCTSSGGTLTEFTSGSDIYTIVCAAFPMSQVLYAASVDTDFVPLAGTTYVEVRLNVKGGAMAAMKVVAGQSDDYLNPATGTLVNTTGGVGGWMDTEPTAYTAGSLFAQGLSLDPQTIDSGSVNGVAAAWPSAEYTQSFGVAVSDALYTAMFNKQRNPNAGGRVTLDYPIPNICGAADTTEPECVPKISRADMAAIMSSQVSARPKTQGAEFLGAPAGTQLRYLRSAETSGTQPAAQSYFLGINAMLDPLVAIPAPTTLSDTNCGGTALNAANGLRSYNTGRYCVIATGSTTDLRNELNRATYGPAAATNYAIGILSGQNTQAAQQWKWVRLCGPIGEDAKPGTIATRNVAPMVSGHYDFYYQSHLFYASSNAAVATFFNAVTARITAMNMGSGLIASPCTGNPSMPYHRNCRVGQTSVRGAN